MLVNCVLRDGSASSFLIRDVLYVPVIDRALFSYRQIMFKGYWLEGERDILRLVKNNEVWLEATYDGALPHINEVDNFAHCTYEFWHEALGHSAPTSIAKTVKRVDDASPIPPCPDDFHCQACTLSKMPRSTPSSRGSRVSVRGAYIHSDLCGPFPVPSLSNARYCISFICDNTKYTWIRFIKNKSDASTAIVDFVNQIENQHDIRIKSFRTDNGGEYVQSKVSNVFAQKGISHDLTPHYSPESNGVAERFNRSLGEAVRAMLSSVNEKRLWAEAANNYVDVENRQSHSVIKDQTPYELFHGTMPSISHLQPFGRECYVQVPKQKRLSGSKLQARAQRGPFMGYTKVDHHYRVFISEIRRTVVSADVYFPGHSSERT